MRGERRRREKGGGRREEGGGRREEGGGREGRGREERGGRGKTTILNSGIQVTFQGSDLLVNLELARGQFDSSGPLQRRYHVITLCYNTWHCSVAHLEVRGMGMAERGAESGFWSSQLM